MFLDTRLRELPVSVKVLDTCFLIAVGIGYLFAMLHTLYTHQGHDGRAGLSVEDIRIAYYGKHQQTRLGAMINGSMGIYLPDRAEKDRIVHWIENGADEAGYNADVRPILVRNCTVCHSSASPMAVTPLESYEDLKRLAVTDTGASIQTLVRVSHIHMFGIALILFMVGRIFVLSELPSSLKALMVAIPFIAVMLDIFSWYLTKWLPGFAVVVYVSGILMGVSVMGQVLISIRQMWWRTEAGPRPGN